MTNPNTEQCEHENQNRKDSDPIEQANPDVTIYIHAAENEAEDVRGTVLCEENDDPGERYSPVDKRESIVHFKDACIPNVQVVARHDKGGNQGFREPHQNPRYQGRGGYYEQGGIYGQGQGNTFVQNQDGYYGPPQSQGRQQWQGPPPPNIARGWSSMASRTPMQKPQRGPFIRKVFTMLFICMACTSAFTICTFVIPGMRAFCASAMGAMLGTFGMMLSFVMMYVMLCSECSRRAPYNCICLVVVVVAECLLFGFITSRFKLKIIILALAVMSIVVLVCLCLAFTQVDFTKCYMFILVAIIALIAFSVVFMVIRVILNEVFPVTHIVMTAAFTVVQSMVLVFIMQIQMILGGRTLELGVDDWAIGTFMLYTSIMTIFIDTLSMFSGIDL